MSERVILELPDELARRARTVAVQTDRSLEQVLVAWIDRAVPEPPLETLSDAQVLALCDSWMDPAQQEELSELLARHREGPLQGPEQDRLEELLRLYRRGLVRKGQAWKLAVDRGLKPRLDNHGASLLPG